MHQQWESLESWLKANDPELLADLNPPATDSEIHGLEGKLGVTLPEDFVECLKVHNGQQGKAGWLYSGTEFLSTHRILAEWMIWKELLDGGNFVGAEAEPEAGIKPVWWSPAWIPFTYNGSGDPLCIDLDPAEQGQIGQVISLWHDDGARKKKADSFTQWFSAFVDRTT